MIDFKRRILLAACLLCIACLAYAWQLRGGPEKFEAAHQVETKLGAILSLAFTTDSKQIAVAAVDSNRHRSLRVMNFDGELVSAERTIDTDPLCLEFTLNNSSLVVGTGRCSGGYEINEANSASYASSGSILFLDPSNQTQQKRLS
jgi:hypothetical protein